MKINGEHMDDARFKTLVDILIGRCSISTPAANARWAAAAIAKKAVKEMMAWDAQFNHDCSLVKATGQEGR